MPFHRDITTKSAFDQLENIANTALDLAATEKTHNIGSVYTPNGDGTGTLAGALTGGNGMVQWVNDKTAPGRPTGLSAASSNGAVTVSWDGTLEGGMPPDFSHIEIVADEGKGNTIKVGSLTRAGSQSIADVEGGKELTFTATAFDDAHDMKGNSTPNESGSSAPVTVTVKSAVDASDIKDVQKKAQDALDKAGDAQKTADGKNRIIKSVTEPSHDGLAAGDLWFQVQNNLIQNGDFETGQFEPWKVTRNATIINSSNDAAGPRNGKYALRLDTNGDIDTGDFPVSPGETVTFSFWLASGPGRWVNFNIYYEDGSTGDYHSTPKDDGSLYNKYVHQVGGFTVTEGHTSAHIKIYNNVSFVRIDDASVYVGDTPSGSVIGVKVWDGTKWNDMVMLANKILVASSVGTTEIADNAITTGKISANAVTALQIAANSVTADKVDVGDVTAAIVKSDKFTTEDGLTGFNENGFYVKNADGTSNMFSANSDGVVAQKFQGVGGFSTAESGNRIVLKQIDEGNGTIGAVGGMSTSNTFDWMVYGEHSNDGHGSKIGITIGQQNVFSAAYGFAGGVNDDISFGIPNVGSVSMSAKNGGITFDPMPGLKAMVHGAEIATEANIETFTIKDNRTTALGVTRIVWKNHHDTAPTAIMVLPTRGSYDDNTRIFRPTIWDKTADACQIRWVDNRNNGYTGSIIMSCDVVAFWL